MVTAKTGLAKTIREFVRANPGAMTCEIAHALKVPSQDVSRELSRMVRAGTIIAEKVTNAKSAFVIGAEPWAVLRKAPEERVRKPRPKAPPRVRHSLELAVAKMETKSARHEPAPKRSQTVEEFLANGGTIETLPVTWATPDRYPPMGYASRRYGGGQ